MQTHTQLVSWSLFCGSSSSFPMILLSPPLLSPAFITSQSVATNLPSSFNLSSHSSSVEFPPFLLPFFPLFIHIIHPSTPPLFDINIILRSPSSSLVCCKLLVLFCIPSILPSFLIFGCYLSLSLSPSPTLCRLSRSPAERGIKKPFYCTVDFGFVRY